VIFFKLRDGKWQRDFSHDIGAQQADREVQLRLCREKRKFIAYYSIDEEKWNKLGKFTELHPKYSLGFIAIKGGSGSHEVLQKSQKLIG